jgi:hypothetical protein
MAGVSMKLPVGVLTGILASYSAVLSAGNPFYFNMQVNPDPAAGALGINAVKNSGVSLVRNQVPGQIAYEMAGPDGPGIGRIYSPTSGPSYVLTDIGSQFSSILVPNQHVLAVLECFQGQFGWEGPAYSAASSTLVTKPSIIGGRLIAQPLILTQVPLPSLIQASPTNINIKIPPYTDNGGQATSLELWRQGSDGVWQALTAMPLTSSVQVFADVSVAAGASYWYGISVVYAWPGGSGEGALPAVPGQYVSQARAVSSLMVAADVQPSPTASPTALPAINHDLGQAGWAAGPNPSRDGKFRIQFHTDKAATWKLSAFDLDGSMVRTFSGSDSQNGWQVAGIDLAKQASGIYLLDLRVKQEGEAEKTLPIRKVAIIR